MILMTEKRRVYDIDDLADTWNAGWNKLKQLGQSLYGKRWEPPGDHAKSDPERIMLILNNVLDCLELVGQALEISAGFPPSQQLLNLAAATQKKPYEPVMYPPKVQTVGFLKTVSRPRVDP